MLKNSEHLNKNKKNNSKSNINLKPLILGLAIILQITAPSFAGNGCSKSIGGKSAARMLRPKPVLVAAAAPTLTPVDASVLPDRASKTIKAEMLAAINLHDQEVKMAHERIRLALFRAEIDAKVRAVDELKIAEQLANAKLAHAMSRSMVHPMCRTIL